MLFSQDMSHQTSRIGRKHTDACLPASLKYELIVIQACVDSLHCQNQWVSTYITTSLTLILHDFTLDSDIPTDCKWKLKPCKAMMFSTRNQNHNFSRSYCLIIPLLHVYSYFLILFKARDLNLSEEYVDLTTNKWKGRLRERYIRRNCLYCFNYVIVSPFGINTIVIGWI